MRRPSPLARCGAAIRWAVAIAAAAQAGCSRSGDAPPVVPTPSTGMFRDVTADSGVAFTYRNGEEADRYAILESLGGGVAAFDFDGDGRLDLFFPAGGYFDGPDKKEIKGHPPKLYRNRGGFQFEDVTAAAGLATLADGAGWFYTHGAAAGDYDRDGWPDLLVTGYGRVALFHNEPAPGGGRRFREVTRAAGLLGPHFWATSAAWGDLDGDGWADLYVCQYVNWSNANDPPCPGYYPGVSRDVCPPAKFDARPHALYRNRGDGTFENVTAAAGLRADRPDGDYGKGLGVLIADVDEDGKPDVYVANDTTDNFLYLNRSTPGRVRFDDLGTVNGVARDGGGMMNGSMGVDAGEYDGSGRPAIWVTNYENEYHALYQNRGAGPVRFGFATSAAGLAVLGPQFVGFGTVFADVDSDGWEDIVVSNGHVIRHSPKNNISQRPIVYRNVARGAGRGFEDARADAGSYFAESHRGRGLAVADLNNDGRLDLVFSHINQPVRVLKNVPPENIAKMLPPDDATGGHNWVGVELAARDRRDVVGAKVVLQVGIRTLTRFQTAGRSYLSSSDPRRVFAIGAGVTFDKLTVHWPTGEPRVESWTPDAVTVLMNRYNRLEQGKGKPE